MNHQPAITVRNNPDRHRYELLEGDTVIGKAHWVAFEEPGVPQRIFYHTVVDDARSGQGLAAKLARHALDETIGQGLQIVPVCPYIKAFIRKHPEYRPHTVRIRPDHLEAIPC